MRNRGCFKLPDNTVIAQRLRKLRGIESIKTVANACGISPSALSMYENGARIPRDEIKVKLAQYYATTVEAIFFTD